MPLLAKETELFPDDLFALDWSAQPWIVAHVRSRQEKVLARHLMRAGVPFYLPQIEKASKRIGRIFKSYVPLFPGYVFLRETGKARDTAWRSHVVASVLEVENQPLLHEELAQLRRLQEAGASLTPHLEIVAGSPVRITDGVFAGYTGVVTREKERSRLIVTITHLQRAVAVELSREAVVSSPK